MKKRLTKLGSAMLSVVMLLGIMAVYPFAETLDALKMDTRVEVIQPISPTLPDKIPLEIIGQEKAWQAKHERRLPQAEGDMNTICLANEDGTHSYITQDTNLYENKIELYDFHFWYQTYDGTWANKHGSEGTAPEKLPAGDTPFTNNSDGWDAGDYDQFYDGTIYSYIVTVE